MCVVFIHTKFPGDMGALIDAFSRTAVAYFFIVSGWFSWYEDREKASEKCRKRLLHTIKLLIISFVLYLVWGGLLELVRGGAGGLCQWLTTVLAPEQWLRFFLLNAVAVAEPLWYLSALIYCYGAWLLISRFRWEHLAGILAAVLLAAALGGQVFSIAPLKETARTAWLYGIPVFTLANRWHEALARGMKLSGKTISWMIALSVSLTGLEWHMLGKMEFSAGSILLAFSLFSLAIRQPALFSNKAVCTIGERYSMYVYILHWAVMSIVLKLAAMLKIEGFRLFSWLYPIAVFVLTLAMAMIAEYVAKKISVTIHTISERIV